MHKLISTHDDSIKQLLYCIYKKNPMKTSFKKNIYTNT